MKPEFILLAQNFALNQAYLTRILEGQSVAMMKAQGHPDEVAEAFAKMICDECHEDYEKHLRKTLENLMSVYPEVSGGSEPLDDLMRRIQLS